MWQSLRARRARLRLTLAPIAYITYDDNAALGQDCPAIDSLVQAAPASSLEQCSRELFAFHEHLVALCVPCTRHLLVAAQQFVTGTKIDALPAG